MNKIIVNILLVSRDYVIGSYVVGKIIGIVSWLNVEFFVNLFFFRRRGGFDGYLLYFKR